MRFFSRFAFAALPFFLAACGGGGGGGAPTISTTAAGVEGFWSGPASTGYTVDAVILENGQTWGIYSAGSTIYGALYGYTTVTGSSLSISGTDFNFLDNSLSQGVLSGSYAARTSINATSNLGPSVALSYDNAYDQPASQASLAGTYGFRGRSGLYTLVPGNVTINSSGAFSLLQTGCSTAGSITPRPNGKNVFNVTLSSAGPNCAAGYGSLAGVGYLDTSVVPNRFLILALKPDQSDGLIVLGTRQ